MSDTPAAGRRGWLDGDSILVTGGGSGLGRALTDRFVEEGARVTVVDHDPDKLAVLEKDHGTDTVRAVHGDVTSLEDLRAAVATAEEAFGGLDTLVPNAGIWDYHRTLTRLGEDDPTAAFDELFHVNVLGYLLAAQAAWKSLVASRGSIVFTLSNASFWPNGGGPLYTASKHAGLGLMRELAYELAPKVRVNAVAPGGMRTDLRGPASLDLGGRSISRSFDKAAARGGSAPMVPLYESTTEPEDFTGPYVLLASRRDSGNVTGTVVPVDGGIAVRGFATPAGGADL
ncbi:3-(cis-5,6-dihydroxycyclohexa-1,3-dien-1-yl)propanoate dehydrogenase [Nocardiopsis sp. HNM0947]|uniref:3-(Cis-5,6-dihydroxycyclohexa-1, 3-dien-1-yl)propanoate dehydrogenase n=1 Tax=Nocardiopsis coralli TaxID=2772213 RepID=A0ABR9P0Z5_9ACTN|nr:3-(cis-5,6-dihydroxycyclohexa-1,3-dien-1-yl)propanoate dehydrogenase [Nocardiopsis coralli]MBE2997520.1 3-(cis-5,6-dihydroxycyclohexa-1,3-dien-1-yl)propanoate dehydrogenase [Nocardiopsis coralli]